jgi:hypothetical protein
MSANGGFVSLGPKSGRLVCGGANVTGCGAMSRPVAHSGGAAPEVKVALELRADGWWDNCGTFNGMILGISALCPACSGRGAKGAGATPDQPPETDDAV